VKVFSILVTLGFMSPKDEQAMHPHEIEKLLTENEQLKTILGHLLPENSGQYFICGGSTELDADGLPESILVCPAFGTEGSAIYRKSSGLSGPGW
jgi:hypothetical protein